MSYTAPQYVDTKEQAVLALASTIAGEDKSALGDGSVNKALDVLADVLAQQDVTVPQTNAGAILALAQYAQGGGGAQTTDVYLWNYTEDAELAEIVPTSVKYVSGFADGTLVFSEISFENVTETDEIGTLHGIHMSNVPAGATFNNLSFSWPTNSNVSVNSFGFGYSSTTLPSALNQAGSCCPMPISGRFVSGSYELVGQV